VYLKLQKCTAVPVLFWGEACSCTQIKLGKSSCNCYIIVNILGCVISQQHTLGLTKDSMEIAHNNDK